MDYARPTHTAQQYNAAGKFISSFDPDDFIREELWGAIDLIAQFRSAHHYPLDSIYTTLRRRARRVHEKALTAQRIKRHVSVVHKLIYQPNMKLTQMQDIGGCRAVMPNLKSLNELHTLYLDQQLGHNFVGEKDYIRHPKETGYRGVHLKYRFNGHGNSLPWDNLKIEIQLRTMLQHKWATAVEVAGTFTNTALKSNRGHAQWLRFFSLMSSIFALREGLPTIPNTPKSHLELCTEIRDINVSHRIVPTLTSFHTLIPRFEEGRSRARYYLVILNPLTSEVDVRAFKKEENKEADAAYAEAEKANLKKPDIQVVLVSVPSTTALKRAYPNYFLDTADFLREVLAITGAIA